MVVAAAVLFSFFGLLFLFLSLFSSSLDRSGGDERRDQRPQIGQVFAAEPLEAAVGQAVLFGSFSDRGQCGTRALVELGCPGGARGRAGASPAAADAAGACRAGAAPVLSPRDSRDGTLDQKELSRLDVPRGQSVASQGLGVGDAEGEPGGRGGEGGERGRVWLGGGGGGGRSIGSRR